MATTSSSSGPSDMTSAPPIVKVHTQDCLEEIIKMSPGELANVIVLLGRTGVGKSALLEYLTNSLGHSRNSKYPVTLNFELEPIEISGRQFYIIDTPGFDAGNEQTVFREIIQGIEAVRTHAKIVGVMVVTRINDSRDEAADKKLFDFVAKLCGPAYAAQIRVVTNFWSAPEPEDKTEFEERLEKCLPRWRAVLGEELKEYRHGRRYNSFGEDANECLKWRGNSEDIKTYAKAMVHRHYGGDNPRDPVIIQELSESRSPAETTAGMFLGMEPSPQSSSSAPESFPSQPEGTPPPPTTPEFGEEESPMPSASSRRPDSNESQSQTHPESSSTHFFGARAIKMWNEYVIPGIEYAVDNIVIPVAKNVLVPQAEKVVNDMFSGRTSGGNVPSGEKFEGTGGEFPPGLDYQSSRDHFDARGMASSLEDRTKWAQERGITLEPGSQAFGEAVRRAIMREKPL